MEVALLEAVEEEVDGLELEDAGGCDSTLPVRLEAQDANNPIIKGK